MTYGRNSIEEMSRSELETEVRVLRAECSRAAEIIGAQTFDLPRLAKVRRGVLVNLAKSLLRLSEGDLVVRANSLYDIQRTAERVRGRFPEDLL